jgi:hypothetical protein
LACQARSRLHSKEFEAEFVVTCDGARDMRQRFEALIVPSKTAIGIHLDDMRYAAVFSNKAAAGLEAQLVEPNAYGCERTYQEQGSAVATRTQLEAAIDMLREGDKLVVTKLDRLARPVYMGDSLEQIEAKGAGLVIVSMGNERVDTTTAKGKLVLNMMVSVAQF